MPGLLLRQKVVCFNPGPLVIWCFANGTTLTHSFHSFRKRFQVQYHTSEIFYRNFLTHGKRCLFPERSVRVSTWRRLLLQNVAMVAKKLLVDDKITACVKQISWVLYAKFRIEKRLVKHFAFLKNVCYQCNLSITFLASSNPVTSCWLATTNFLGVYCYFPVILLVNFV